MRLKGKDLTGEFFSVTPHNYHVGIMLVELNRFAEG
jgi:hypothetical protein